MEETIAQELVAAGREYEQLFVPALFAPWTQHVIAGARIDDGSSVLDIACGTGVLARAALSRAGRKGRIVGVDPAPGMIAAAAEIEPGIQWLTCSAEDLQLDACTFDSVISQFGMMFFRDRQAATREMFRVLKPGGTVAIAIWNSVEHNPAYADVISVLQEQVGSAAADTLRLPYSLGNAEPVTSALDRSGFTNIGIETKIEMARFPSSRHMVEAELRGWLPLFDIHLKEEKINQVLVASDRMLRKYATDSDEASFPTSAHIITARKND